MDFKSDRNFALLLDKDDPLSSFRDRFNIPEETIYFDGNSLGLMAKDSEITVNRVMNEWRDLAIKGWLGAKNPWFYSAENTGAMASQIIGAQPDEVILTGSTTVNIHSLIGTFYDPRGKRTKILADELTFPSDIYALKGQIKSKGLDPENHLVLAKSRDGYLLDENQIIELMDETIALIFLPSVLYRSGQLLDMERLTKEAHNRNILIGFDCCHSAGVIPHKFDDWGVDFATFCSYKYMNGGPGAPAFLYVNRKHFDKEPVLSGWFGYRKDKQFELLLDFEHQRSAGGWQISTPVILGGASVEGALKVTLEAGMDRIYEKSIRLTSYFIYLIEEFLENSKYGYTIITPKDARKRSGHVSVRHETESYRINEALKSRGVVPDFRPPDVIRLAPIALYNTFTEVWDVVHFLKTIIDTNEYKYYTEERLAVT